MAMKFELNIEGICLFYKRPDAKGTDIWMLADAHHLARIEPVSGVAKQSSGILTPTEISLAGWGVRICEGANRTEIPEGKLTAMPDPGVVPHVSLLNTPTTLRPDLEQATPEALPATLNSLIRLRGGELVARPPDPKATYGGSDWKFDLGGGSGPTQKLTHRFRYTVMVQNLPISLVFNRGAVEEWVELKPFNNVVEVLLAIDDVKGHVNIAEDRVNKVASLLEWPIHHRCFLQPQPVVPTTAYRPDPGGGLIGGADPMCPGGQVG